MLIHSETRQLEGRRPRASLMARLARRWCNMIETRRGLRLLSAADDTMLKDIGISRGDVERLVRHGRPRTTSGRGD
jgi:uncharacterized protein YjiS (DUF1127 family)